uniref:Uncharacterized protein n=1 Tax=Phytophthora fragariae TaxID=53985 RepID=A0A6A3F3F7_9STRA|nr:hypothetical protein PF009_g9876 [Phytophthora fragariae]
MSIEVLQAQLHTGSNRERAACERLEASLHRQADEHRRALLSLADEHNHLILAQTATHN